MTTARLCAVQSVLTLLFLFSGLYKEVIPAPPYVDYTVLTAILLCVSLVPDRQIVNEIFRQPVLWLFVLLVAYLAIAGWPLSSTGLSRLAREAVFGIPAMVAGYVLARKDALAAFGVSASIGGLAIASIALVQWTQLEELPGGVEVLSGGYQLTTVFLAFGFLYAALRADDWKWAAVAGALACGMMIVGSLPSLYTALLAGFVLLLGTRRFIHARNAMLTMVAAVALMTATIGAPAGVLRVIWKFEQAAETPVTRSDHTASPREAAPRVLVERNGQIVDATGRSAIFKQAVVRWMESPLTGHGLGNVEYVQGYWTAHNAALEMLAEGGAIGVLIYAALCLAAGIPALLAWRERPYILALLVVAMAVSMVSGAVGERRVLMFVIGAAGAVLVHWVGLSRALSGRSSPSFRY